MKTEAPTDVEAPASKVKFVVYYLTSLFTKVFFCPEGTPDYHFGGLVALYADIETLAGILHTLTLEVVINSGSIFGNLGFNGFDARTINFLIKEGEFEGVAGSLRSKIGVSTVLANYAVGGS